MIPEKRVLMKRTLPFLLVGLLIFIGYLYFFVDVHEMIAIVKGIDLSYYLLAIGVLLLNTVFSSLAWQYFLRPLSVNVPFRKTFLFALIGSFVDILVPAESISGDASKAYLMSKDSGENAGKVVASIVSHRILAMMITLGSLIVGSISLFVLEYKLPALVFNLIILITVGTAISLVFIVLLCFKEQLTQKIIDLLLRFFAFISKERLQLASLRSKAQKALRAFHQAIEVLGKNPRSLVQPVVFSMVSWFLSLLLSFLVFVSIGHTVSLGKIIIVYSIICSIQTAPIGIIAGVGPVDIIMSSLYALLGVPLDVSASATLLIRVLTVWFRLLIGFVAFQWVGIKALINSSR
jgi:uncharacterized protein (TIRG00374 family)